MLKKLLLSSVFAVGLASSASAGASTILIPGGEALVVSDTVVAALLQSASAFISSVQQLPGGEYQVTFSNGAVLTTSSLTIAALLAAYS